MALNIEPAFASALINILRSLRGEEDLGNVPDVCRDKSCPPGFSVPCKDALLLPANPSDVLKRCRC